MQLSELSDLLRAELDAKTAARDEALAAGRSSIRHCGLAIRALHRGEIESADQELSAAADDLARARDAVAGHLDVLYAGFIHDAEKEYAEARLTHALVTGSPLPALRDVGVPPVAYLKGMAESIGELRRHILDLMRHDELARCEQLLGAMDDMYYVLVSMDYPDGITYGLRRLTDVARSIIERTRGDFTVSKVQSALRDALRSRQAD